MKKLIMLCNRLAICLMIIAMATGASLAKEPNNEALVLTLSEGQRSPTATIDAAAWLAGNWSGKSADGIAEESYLPPAGGAIIGMFRQTKDDKPIFYEFLAISEHEGSLLYRIKHFNPDLHGWEKQDESVEFPLVKITDHALYFDGLTYLKTGENTMSAYVRVGDDEGDSEVLGFHFQRKLDD